MRDWVFREVFAAATFATLAASIGAAYWIRVRSRGKAHFDRVDRQDTSALLSKPLMEMVYWASEPLARTLVRLRITANQISWASLALGLGSAYYLSIGAFGSGAFFALASALFDLLDGYVARATNTASDAGEILDATIDRYNEFFFLGALIIYYRANPVVMVLCLFALIGSFMVSYSTARADGLEIALPRGGALSLMRRPERAGYLVIGAALSPLSIYFVEVPYFSEALGYPMIGAVTLVAVCSNLSAIARMTYIGKKSGTQRK